MNLQFYLERLNNSESFKEFIKEFSEAYLCSAFFIIDKEKKDDKYHFDYYVPSTKKIFSFKIESKIEKVPIEILDKKIPEKVSVDHDFDFNDIEKIILQKMEKENVKNKIQKIILSLQKLDEKDFLVGTVFISSLGILKFHLDLSNMKIVLFEKKSFFDMMKIIKKGE
jgi:hypothetical protein